MNQAQNVHPVIATTSKNNESVGDGFFGDLYNKILPKRQDGLLPPSVRTILEKIGNEKVSSLTIQRQPVEKVYQALINTISLGAFKQTLKKLDYDEVFHLSLIVNGKYKLEKLDVISLVEYKPESNPKIERVNIVSDKLNSFTISEMLDKTRDYMGASDFTNYNAKTSNCQRFIDSILSANGVNTQEYKRFINQDSEAIFQNMPSFVTKFSSFATDLASRFNRLIKGEALLPASGLYNVIKGQKKDKQKKKIKSKSMKYISGYATELLPEIMSHIQQ